MNYALRTSRIRSAVMLGAVALIGAAVVAQPASAGKPTKTSYYTLTVGGTSPVAVPYTGADVTMTVTNCGTSPTCSGTAGSSLSSVDVLLPTDWTADATTNVSVSGNDLTVTGKFGVGTPVGVTVTVHPSATGAGEPQTVEACLPDTLTCSYQPIGANPTLELPLSWSLVASPTEVQQNTPFSSLSFRVGDTFGNAVPGVSVGLRVADGYTIDPGLYNPPTPPSTTATAPSTVTDSAGLATFTVAATYTGGPFAVTPYRLPATSPKIEDATVKSDPFQVFQTLADCGHGTCAASAAGNDTTLDASSTATAGTIGGTVFRNGNGNFPSGLNCPNGGSRIAVRPESVQVQAGGDKQAVITWSKQVTLKATDAGTPHWQVCMLAPAEFLNDVGQPAPSTSYAGTTWYLDTVPLCGSSFLSGVVNPCMDLARNAAKEIATITLPGGWAGDPFFH